MKILSEIPTIEEIVKFIESQNPKEAFAYRGDEQALYCTTRIIKCVVVDGYVVHLDPIGLAQYIAGLIRVSSDEQGKNGYSVGDQAERAIKHAIKQGKWIRLFNDSTLSGWLPINDAAMIREMIELKAERYVEVYDSVWLNDYSTRTPAERKVLEDYRDAHRNEILGGLSKMDTDPDAPLEKKRGTQKEPVFYRPALTTLMNVLPEIGEIVMTDQPRLSRCHALTILLSRRFEKAKVNLVGLSEPIVTGKGAQGKLVASLMGQIAEMKLEEVCRGAMRGHERMLSAGKAHASIPNWHVRDDKGQCHFRVETEGLWAGQEARRMAIERCIELFLEGDDPGTLGPKQLVYIMIEEGYPDPTGKGWQIRTIHQMLTSRTLLGEQECYGLRHKVMPAITDELTYDRIQARLFLRRNMSDYDGTITGEVRLGTGLWRCVCGRKMVCAPSRNGYVCPVTLHSRLDKSVRHSVLKIDDCHTFLNGLMTSHVIDMLVENAAGDDRTDAMQAALDTVDEELVLAKAQCEQEMRIKLPEVKAGLAAMGIDEYDPAFDAMKDKGLEAKVRPYSDKVAHLEAQLAEQHMAKDTYVPPVAYKDFGEQVRRWDTLCDSQKNRVIRTVFKEFRVGGTEPEQHVTPVRRTAINAELPPIQLVVTRRGSNYLRRFPAAKEWARSLRYQLQGDHWFGEFRNFEWNDDIRGGDEDDAGITTAVTVESWDTAA